MTAPPAPPAPGGGGPSGGSRRGSRGVGRGSRVRSGGGARGASFQAELKLRPELRDREGGGWSRSRRRRFVRRRRPRVGALGRAAGRRCRRFPAPRGRTPAGRARALTRGCPWARREGAVAARRPRDSSGGPSAPSRERGSRGPGAGPLVFDETLTKLARPAHAHAPGLPRARLPASRPSVRRRRSHRAGAPLSRKE